MRAARARHGSLMLELADGHLQWLGMDTRDHRVKHERGQAGAHKQGVDRKEGRWGAGDDQADEPKIHENPPSPPLHPLQHLQDVFELAVQQLTPCLGLLLRAGPARAHSALTLVQLRLPSAQLSAEGALDLLRSAGAGRGGDADLSGRVDHWDDRGARGAEAEALVDWATWPDGSCSS
jgi:hypothetical protein